MTVFDRSKFTRVLTGSDAFTPAQIAALASAIIASMADAGAPVPGESHEALPLRGAASDLS